MDYLTAFDISASGMVVEKTRLDIIALNLANANSSRSIDGDTYKPLRVISAPKTPSFEEQLQLNGFYSEVMGATVMEIRPMDTAPRLVFDPNHPDANEKGYVAYPDINPVSEMVTLIEATRAYEANVRAMNAAKSMALRALEIGK